MEITDPPAGIAPVADQIGFPEDAFTVPEWIQEQLRDDPLVWENRQRFPSLYQRLKVGWAGDIAESRRAEAQRRVDYLLKMTRAGKRYGAEPMSKWYASACS